MLILLRSADHVFFPSWEEFWVHCAGPKSFDLRVADVCFGGVGLYSGQPLPHGARQEEVRRGVGFLWFKWVVLLLTDFWKMGVKWFENIQGQNLGVSFGICSICKIFGLYILRNVGVFSTTRAVIGTRIREGRAKGCAATAAMEEGDGGATWSRSFFWYLL